MRTVVVGVGNDLRGDDGAGLAVVRSLKNLVPADVELAELQNDLTALPDLLESCDAACIIDAVRSGALPGSIHRFDASDKPLPGDNTRTSTHGVSLSAAIELARLQGTLPRRVLVIGIEGTRFGHGLPLSDVVAQTVQRVCDLVLSEIRSLDSGDAP